MKTCISFLEDSRVENVLIPSIQQTASQISSSKNGMCTAIHLWNLYIGAAAAKLQLNDYYIV